MKSRRASSPNMVGSPLYRSPELNSTLQKMYYKDRTREISKPKKAGLKGPATVLGFDESVRAVCRVLLGESISDVSYDLQIKESTLRSWVQGTVRTKVLLTAEKLARR